MSTTESEAVPAVGTDASGQADNVVVLKFGGTSVAGPERILAVARRLADLRETGARVVGVLSAMGGSTDDLLALAQAGRTEAVRAKLRDLACESVPYVVRSRDGNGTGVAST